MDIKDKNYLIENIQLDIRRYNLKIERLENEIQHCKDMIKVGERKLKELEG
jgi:hypothetical protein